MNGKMILITGVPGTGKTAHVVDMLLGMDQARPLYVHGLNGLTIPHTPCDASKWHEDVPDGAILVIDEVQEVWRPRGPSHQPSDAVKALEKHRHRGVDIIMTTQRPSLLDSNVRGLVGRHIHLRDTGWLGRWMYEWPECSENLAWKTCALKRKYKLPARAFTHYKSASIQTERIKGRSPWLMMGLGFLALAAVVSFAVYRSVSARSSQAKPVEPTPGFYTQSNVKAVAGAGGPLTAASMRASFVPRLLDAPETAPAYDDLRKVVRMRRVIGGYCRNGEGCRCFDQDGLDPGIPQAACFELVRNPKFDPYREPAAPVERRESGTPLSVKTERGVPERATY